MIGRSSHRKRLRRMYQFAPEQDVSLEIGAVDKKTVVAVFNFNVASSNYKTGVTIKKNGVSQTISTATRQSDHEVVVFVLSTDADANDVITFEYNASVGDYYIESDGNNTPIQNFDPRTAYNSIAPVVPTVVSAEIGAVLDTTVVVVFSTPISSSNYKLGVTITVDGIPKNISTATRQVDHTKVYYVIPAVTAGQVVSWDYSTNDGTYVNEDDGAVLESVTVPVTNNVV